MEEALKHVEDKGYENLQDFIRETLREKLFEDEEINGMQTYLASIPSLAKNWISREEDEEWAHLQKEK